VNLYDRYLLPHLIDLACGMGAVMKARSQVVPQAHGRVLEIGIGSGLNLAFYDASKVSAIIGVDPSADMQKLAKTRAAAIRIPVQMIALELGQIQAEDASFDSIVCTFTLCTIPDVDRALAEVRRVVRPGGEFRFLEHGLAPDAGVARWQHRLNGVQQRLAGGCHLTREPVGLTERAGMTVTASRSAFARGPKPWTYLTVGRATV
jgi:ubiquinone/menaquinone biosynthesis C-methylase UbiE